MLKPSIIAWMEKTASYIELSIKPHEATLSKRQLLKILYSLADSANAALADIETRKPATINATEAEMRFAEFVDNVSKVGIDLESVLSDQGKRLISQYRASK